MNKYLMIVTVCIGLASVVTAEETQVSGATAAPEYYPIPSTGGAPLPFSEAAKLGDTL